MDPNKLIPQVRKLALADKAFDQCLALLSYLQVNWEEIEFETVGVCMISGICTTYCKNFISSSGNGSLSNSYSLFDDDKLSQAHNDLMELRNATYAHRDLMRDNDLKQGKLNPDLEWVHLTFQDPGNMVINTQEFHLHPERLPDIKALIEFQRNRLKFDLSDKIMALADGKKYPPGEYVLGEDFP